MKYLLFLFVTAMLAMGARADDDGAEWSIAVAARPADGRQIVYRYRSKFGPAFRRAALPDRVSFAWYYESTDGMPSLAERKLMDQFEDLLGPQVEVPSLSILAMVSTGENLREWTYYTKSRQEFMAKVNDALRDVPRFPVEISLKKDPKWAAYDRFRKGVKE
jgi:hypothetical protein